MDCNIFIIEFYNKEGDKKTPSPHEWGVRGVESVADTFFPSSWTGDYLTKDSVIQFFRESAKRAGIQKHVSTHCLRHSFASHLFESGCDVKYIQALLGHRDPKSTEVYLHVSNKTLLGIRSPFDEMGGEWLWRNHVRYKMYLNGFILLMKRGIALLLIIEKQLIISWTVKQALLV